MSVTFGKPVTTHVTQQAAEKRDRQSMAGQAREPHRARIQQVYVVRIWQEASQIAPTGQWRGSIEYVATGKRLYFTDLAQLRLFIETDSGWRQTPHLVPLAVNTIVVVQDSYRRLTDVLAPALHDAWQQMMAQFPDRPALATMTPQAHAQMCADLFAWVISRLHDITRFTPKLQRIARRYSLHSLPHEHYVSFGDLLFAALTTRARGEFTPEVRQAWAEAYLIITTMLLAPSSTASR